MAAAKLGHSNWNRQDHLSETSIALLFTEQSAKIFKGEPR